MQNSGKVILIFSVNMSGFFQGYAQMMSSVGWRRDNIWSQGSGKNNPWGRSFKVKWLRLHDLSFQRTLHLKNPWNDFKPVKISRDCQVFTIPAFEEPSDIWLLLHEGINRFYFFVRSCLRTLGKPFVSFLMRGLIWALTWIGIFLNQLSSCKG